jgi:hypothetical protein
MSLKVTLKLGHSPFLITQISQTKASTIHKVTKVNEKFNNTQTQASMIHKVTKVSNHKTEANIGSLNSTPT